MKIRSHACLILTVGAALALCCTVPAHGQLFKSTDASAADSSEEAPAKDEKKGGLIQVSWPSIPAPKISFPEIKPPTLSMPKVPMPWSKNGEDEDKTSPFEPIESGARKVSDGTRQAWNGFKGLFKSKPKQQTSSRNKKKKESKHKSSLWQQMFAPEPEPQGPQTVSEWMAQPRLEP